MKTEAAAGINKQINFQGKMTDANGLNVADGTYQFVFRLYTVSSGGVAAWTETVNLSVNDGIFQHALGSTTALPGSVDFNSDNIFLGITFNSDPAGEMTPRIQLTASPYAFNSDQLDGLDASDFVQLNPSVAQTGDIAITGDVEAGSGTITGDLTVDTNTLFVDAANNRVGFGTTSNTQAGVLISLAAPDTTSGSVLGINGTLSSTTNNLYGVGIQPTVNVDSNSDLDFVGVISAPSTATANLDTGTAGLFAYAAAPIYTGSNTIRNLVGYSAVVYNASSGTVTNGRGIEIANPINNGTITTNTGIWLSNQTAGVTDYGIYIGGADTYALFVDAGATRLDGTLAVGDTVTIGASDTTGTLLTLDTKTDAGDPTGVNGGLYYNSNSNKFRCYQNSGWTDCIGAGSGLSSSLTDNIADAWDIQEAANNYININTTNGSEAIGFGNTTTDQDFNFLGDGNLTVDAGTLFVDGTNGRVGIGTTSVASGFQLQIGDGSGNVGVNLAPVAGTGQANICFDDASCTYILGYDVSTGIVKLGANGTLANFDWQGLNLNRNLVVQWDSDLQGDVSIGGLLDVAGQLTVGTSDTTGTLLVLDTKTDTGDPTGANGGMYYNSNAGKFRCYENSAWKDCISSGGSSLFTDGGNFTYLTSTSDRLVVGYNGDTGAKFTVVNDNVNQQVIGLVVADSQVEPVIGVYNTSATELFRLNARDQYSLFFGFNAGASDDGTDNGNIGIGHRTLQSVTTGDGNVAIGSTALQNGTGGSNIAIGGGAQSGADGWFNVGVGQNTLAGALGDENSALGHRALESASDAYGNNAFGNLALSSVTDGDYNIAIGYQAGDNITTGSQNIIIGHAIDAASATGSNQLNIAGLLTSSNYTTGGQWNGALTVTGATTLSASGAASTPAQYLSGSWFTGGTATTTKPQLLVQPSAATSNNWSTSGTGIGVNAASGFAGNLLDLQVNGTRALRVGSDGYIYFADAGDCNGSCIGDGGTGTLSVRGGFGLELSAANGGNVILGADAGASVVFSGMTTDITTGTNENWTVSPNGTGDITFTLDDGTNFQLSGTRTNTGSHQAVTMTLGNDTGVDTVSALGVTVTSAATGDADVLQGIAIADLVSADATVIERALQIGSGWDANLFFNDTTTQIQIANTGVFTFEDDSGNDLLTVTDGGTVGNIGITGNLTANGNTTLGDATSDTITYTGRVASTINPSVNDTYDLGSDALRWRDLYLGGETLHIGTSTTDEGTISYNTTSNILQIGTDATSNGDIAFFTDDLYLDKSSGYVGIGTTTVNNQLTVNGAGVFGGTAATGGDPLEIQGASAGLSLYDRSTGATDRWSIYATGGILRLWENGTGDRLSITNAGNATIAGTLVVSGASASVNGSTVLTEANSSTITGVKYFQSNKGSGTYLGSNTSYQLEAYSSDGGAAAMSFHRAGVFAVNFGLDPDNVLRIGGWSASANRWQLDSSGNNSISGYMSINGGTLTGNGAGTLTTGGYFGYVDAGANTNTAVCKNTYGQLAPCTSSQRFKDNIQNSSYGLDAIRQLQPVTFRWNTNGTNDVGFIAEQVAPIVPQAVMYDVNGEVSSFNYNTMISVAISGLKQLDVQVQSNTIKLSVLEQQLATLSPDPTGYATAASVQSMFATLSNRVEALESGILQSITVEGPALLRSSLTVMGDTFVKNITIDGKFITAGAVPGSTVLGSYTEDDATVTINGNDTAGEVSFTTTSSASVTLGQQFKVTFASPFGAKPRVNLTPTTSASAAARFYTEQAADGFTVFFVDPPEAGKTYGFNYLVVQ